MAKKVLIIDDKPDFLVLRLLTVHRRGGTATEGYVAKPIDREVFFRAAREVEEDCILLILIRKTSGWVCDTQSD